MTFRSTAHTTTRPAPVLRRLAGVAVLAGLVAGASACGSDDGSDAAAPSAVQTASDGSTFNQADVAFATDMIPHHAQAVQMVVIAQGRDLDPEVAALMEDIRTAQVPEIETMSDWLTAWGEPIPETSLDHANADHDGGSGSMEGMDMDMPGMMSADEMSALEDATGPAFEEMWLEMMRAHHEGAIAMATAEIEDGANPEAIALAEEIVASQSAEIETMDELAG